MTEDEDLAFRARFWRDIAEELLKKAKRLRVKAEKLEKESDRLRAAAARELADYLEGVVADFRGP